MLKSREGQRVPSTPLMIRRDGQWQTVDSTAFFAGRRVVLFALPGAFTPTCSSTHVPRFNELASLFRANGIDEVCCLSVNDPFVMERWQDEQQATALSFIADGNGHFSQAMGMLVDKAELHFGKRSWRYSMVVRDGVIEKMFVEPERPGDPFEVSDADTMRAFICPQSRPQPRISMFTRPGCNHCARAKASLAAENLRFEEIRLGEGGLSLSTLTAVTGESKTPQVYVDGERVGGADELERWLSERRREKAAA
jgi:peroxiredoxin/glutaredoxin